MDHTQDGRMRVLKEWGNNGKIPFYLVDDTGKTLIIPKEAIMQAGIKETIRGNMFSTIFGARGMSGYKPKELWQINAAHRADPGLNFSSQASSSKQSTFWS